MSDSPDPAGTEDKAEETAPSAAELEAAGQESMFGDPAPAAAPSGKPDGPAPAGKEPLAQAQNGQVDSADNPASEPVSGQPYRVLARKYRPQTFSELIGQEPMVRTLANAIKRDRLAHAFLMTGVRGVGKTSTARLIAKALNCIGPDGNGGPTIDPCGQCEPCKAIAEGRHIDVIEMDAASNTGVDDVREIIEAVRYAAVSARYKIYIIDEVHMLSRNAFNALLKTLEEPPAHVKFLFATTEVEKLPVTVLSRTQRFDLRRIPVDMLQSHFAHICALEGAEAEDEALHMIAAAAEGSVRDGLSILDQAIAHADLDEGGCVSATRVREMLGLADKGAQNRLLANLLEGKAADLLAGVDDQYALGVEPLAMMRSLMEITHRIALAQVSGQVADIQGTEERSVIEGWASHIKPGQVHRLWQLLLKGYQEVQQAPDPLVAAQMALLRALHAADMPDPGTLAKKLDTLAASGALVSDGAGTSGQGGVTARAETLVWSQLVAQVEQAGQALVASVMKMQVRVIELAPGRLRYTLAPPFRDDIASQLRDGLLAATGTRWTVEQGQEEGSPTLVEQDEAAARSARDALLKHPLVEAAFAAFPDAELIDKDGSVTRTDNRQSRQA
ncbi:MAG: DNA polymerase III subunit gamma/tau [Sphingomonadaceae bacterium]